MAYKGREGFYTIHVPGWTWSELMWCRLMVYRVQWQNRGWSLNYWRSTSHGMGWITLNWKQDQKSNNNAVRKTNGENKSANLCDNISNVLFVLCSEVRGNLHQDGRLQFSLQGISLLQHLSTLWECENTRCGTQRLQRELDLLVTKQIGRAFSFLWMENI